MNEHCSVHDERCASTASQVWFLNARGRSAGVGAAARWEVKTIRRKLRELAGRAKAAFLHRLLARRRAAQDEEALAYLYIDGHVRAYSGKRKIGKAYVTTRKSVMPAETDYWVNLTNGQPLLVVHAHANERLTQILCNRFDIDPVELAYRMFGRWKQENWFKYMDEPFALDVLADDGTEPDDPDRLVVNPAWRKLDKAVRTARAKLQKAEAAYGRVSLSNASSRKRDRCAGEAEAAREALERLRRERRETTRKVRLGDVSDGDPVKLSYERKLLTDTIKMCAYDVETHLTEMLDGAFSRHEDEGRAVVREIFQTPGDLTLSPGELHIHLQQLSAPRYTQAMMSLCNRVNAMDLTLPENSLRLRFHVQPRPETRQN